MYQTNQTETFRERELLLLHGAENRRLAQRLRTARSRQRSQSDRPMAKRRRAIALWGRAGAPSFKA